MQNSIEQRTEYVTAVVHLSVIIIARKSFRLRFYSVSALLAMQTAVLAKGILSVCMYVRLSFCHTEVYCPDE